MHGFVVYWFALKTLNSATGVTSPGILVAFLGADILVKLLSFFPLDLF